MFLENLSIIILLWIENSMIKFHPILHLTLKKSFKHGNIWWTPRVQYQHEECSVHKTKNNFEYSYVFENWQVDECELDICWYNMFWVDDNIWYDDEKLGEIIDLWFT